MLRLLLVRHGETEWNATGRYQGQTDIPLNAAGHRQAKAVAERLAAERIDAIYASDLLRAWATAEAIAEPHDVEPRPDARLREMNYGDWQGLTYQQIAEQAPEALAAWNADRVHRTPPGGESLADLATRAESLLAEIRAAHLEGTVAVVSHGGTVRMILCVLLGHPPASYWQFEMDNTGVSEIELQDRGPVVIRWNDVQHLKDNHRQTVF
jgi:alpha-ribazole phosphatase